MKKKCYIEPMTRSVGLISGMLAASDPNKKIPGGGNGTDFYIEDGDEEDIDEEDQYYWNPK